MDEGEDRVWLTPSRAEPLDGGEHFAGLDATVSDFWRWAFSDLRDNTTRGILAEYLVGRAVHDARSMRIGWDNFDALSADGTRIEVKCSAFLQSWRQKRHSDLSFGRLTAREFDWARDEYSADARARADVFVFAVQTQRDPSAYDMLDLTRWEFWVTDAASIRDAAVKTVGIGWVRAHAAGPLSYDQLADAIRAAAASPHDEGAAYLEMCGIEREVSMHGSPGRDAATSSAATELLISPRGVAHLPGCWHKGDDPDFSRWAMLDVPGAWERLGNGEQLSATGGQRPDLVARSRCEDCVSHGPW